VDSGASGGITDSGTGMLTIAGITTLAAGASDVILDHSANDFGGSVAIANTANTTIHDVNNLSMGNVSASGDVTLTAMGDILFTGITAVGGNLAADTGAVGGITAIEMVTIAGSTTLNAGTSDIRLANSDSDFGGMVTIISAADATIRDLNDLTLGNVSATGDVSLTAAGKVQFTETIAIGDSLYVDTQASGGTSGAISDTGAGILVVAGRTILDAGASDITLDNAANDFVNTVTIISAANVTLHDATDLILDNMWTAGDVRLTAGSDVRFTGPATIAGNLFLDAGVSGAGGAITDIGAGMLTVSGLTTLGAGTGDVILDNAANDFVDAVTIIRAANISIHDANQLSLGDVSASGDVYLATVGNVQFTRPAMIDGNLSVDTGTGGGTGGAITDIGAGVLAVAGATTLHAGVADITLDNPANDFGGVVTIPSAANATLHDANNLALGNVTTSGNVTLHAEGAIHSDMPAMITADALTGTAGGSIALLTAVNTFTAASTGSGTISVAETDTISLVDVQTADGSITVTAGDTITAMLVRSQADSDANDISLTTSPSGDIEVSQVDAGGQGDVILDAAEVIAADISSMITADELTVAAGGSITLITTVDTLTAAATGVGSISVTETDAVSLVDVQAANGSITVQAGGTITAVLVRSQTDSDANDISLAAFPSGDIEVGQIDAGVQGDVILNAADEITDIATMITANELWVTAGGSITLITTVDVLTATASGAGDITVNETDEITLADVTAADGSITVTAGGNLTALHMTSFTDTEDNNINLTTTAGDVLIGYIEVGRSHSGFRIESARDIREIDAADPDVDVSGSHALMIAAGEFGSSTHPELNLEIDISLLGASGGDVIYDLIGDVAMIVFASGTVDITATGTLTAVHMASGAGDISLESSADIILGYVDAGADTGVVHLTAAGSILEMDPDDPDIDLVTSAAYLSAGVSIGGSDANRVPETEIDTLIAEVTGSTLSLNEATDIDLVSISAPDGEITIKAGGDILISGPVSTGQTAGRVRFETDDQLYMTGNDPVTTYLLDVSAQAGIFLHTQAAMIDALVENAGKIEIHEADAVVLRKVTNASGPIHVISGGTMTATHVECLADERGNNVGLMTTSGDIRVDYVGVGTKHNQISLSSAEDILEVYPKDPEIDLRGAVGLLYAEGKIDRGLDRSFKRIHKWSKKTAFYQFDRGRALHLHGVKGDLELFIDLDNWVCVSATGDINVVHLNSNGHDIALRSTSGGISVAHLETGPGTDDIELKAKGDIHLAGELYSGGVGQITAGDDIEIYADGDVAIFGSISAGGYSKVPKSKWWWHKPRPDVTIDSESEIFIHGEISSQDDVEIWADDGILITGVITAHDEIEIGTCGDLTISAAITAGSDLELYAGHALTTTHSAATLTAGADVEIETRYGDIELLGAVQSGSGRSCSPDVQIDSGGALGIHAPITALDDVEIWADDGILITRAITANDEIEIGTCGDLTISAAIAAGSDLKLWASKAMAVGGIAEAGNDISIHAKRAVSISAPIAAGDDIKISSRYGDVLLDGTLTAGSHVTINANGDLDITAAITAGDDLDLYAGGSLTTTNGLATLTAGGDVDIETRHGNITVHGSITAGNGTAAALQSKSCRWYSQTPDVWIDSGAGLFIHGDISAEDDIEIQADEEIIVTASISAGDELEIETSGAMSITGSAEVKAGDDIDLYCKSNLIISGLVASSDDIRFTSFRNVLMDGTVQAADDIYGYARRDITVSGLVAAKDRICLKAQDDMHITAAGVISGLDGNPAKRIYLYARDQMIIEGKLFADRIIIR